MWSGKLCSCYNIWPEQAIQNQLLLHLPFLLVWLLFMLPFYPCNESSKASPMSNEGVQRDKVGWIAGVFLMLGTLQMLEKYRRTRYKYKLVVGCVQANHKLQSISLLYKCTMLPCEGPRISGCNIRNIPVSSPQGVREEGEAGDLGGSGVGRPEGARSHVGEPWLEGEERKEDKHFNNCKNIHYGLYTLAKNG